MSLSLFHYIQLTLDLLIFFQCPVLPYAPGFLPSAWVATGSSATPFLLTMPSLAFLTISFLLFSPSVSLSKTKSHFCWWSADFVSDLKVEDRVKCPFDYLDLHPKCTLHSYCGLAVPHGGIVRALAPAESGSGRCLCCDVSDGGSYLPARKESVAVHPLHPTKGDNICILVSYINQP